MPGSSHVELTVSRPSHLLHRSLLWSQHAVTFGPFFIFPSSYRCITFGRGYLHKHRGHVGKEMFKFGLGPDKWGFIWIQNKKPFPFTLDFYSTLFQQSQCIQIYWINWDQLGLTGRQSYRLVYNQSEKTHTQQHFLSFTFSKAPESESGGCSKCW